MTGGTASSFASLASPQVAGAVLTPPFDDKAVSKGFKKYMSIGDLMDIPTSGLIAVESRGPRTIATEFKRPSQHYSMQIAWIRSNRPESARMIADKFKITPAEAQRSLRDLDRHVQ